MTVATAPAAQTPATTPGTIVAPPSIHWRETLANSSVQIGANLQLGLISGFLLFFYTDVFGISAAAGTASPPTAPRSRSMLYKAPWT